MAEKIKIAELRTHVAQNLSSQSPLPVEFVANVIVELLGYKKELQKALDFNNFKRLTDLVEEIFKVNEIKKYSKEALLTLVKRKYLALLAIEELKLIVPDTKYFWYPDSLETPMNFFSVSGNPPQLRDNYGDQPFDERMVDVMDDRQVENGAERNRKKARGSIDDNQISAAQNRLLDFFRALGQKRKDDENCYRHDLFAERDLIDVHAPRYAWEWNFTQKEYEGMGELMEQFSPVLSGVIENKICCKLVQLYASEWYKREYNGNDRGGNVFSRLRIDAKQICLTIFEETDVFRDNLEGGDLRWKDTIYVNGGLPLRYLLGEKNNSFKQTIINIIKQNDEGIDILEDITVLCNNSVVNQSLHARENGDDDASVYDFIKASIIEKELIVNDFEDYKKIIREAADESLKQKFHLVLDVYKPSDRCVIMPQLHLKPEKNGKHYAISNERLQQWGGQSDMGNFMLNVECNRHLIWQKKFRKTIGDEYVCFPKSDRFSLDLVEESLLTQRWSVNLNEKKISVLENPLSKNGYVQLYSKDGLSWSTQASYNYLYSAVLFDRQREISLNELEDIALKDEYGIESELFGWKQINEELSFTVDGRMQFCFCQAGQLVVQVSHLHQLTKKTEKFCNMTDKKLPVKFGDETRQTYLINQNQPIAFNVYTTSWKQSVIQLEGKEEKHVKVRYRYCGDDAFDDLKNDSITRPGLVEFKISMKANPNKTKSVFCFVLDKDADIDNDTQQAITSFRNFKGLPVCESGRDLVIDNDTQRKYWLNKLTPERPMAYYDIFDGNAHLQLEMYQPIDDYRLIRKGSGRVFKPFKNDRGIVLPILYLRYLDIYKLPENTNKSFETYCPRLFQAITDYQYDMRFPDVVSERVQQRAFTHTDVVRRRNELEFPVDCSNLNFVYVSLSDSCSLHDIYLSDDGRHIDLTWLPECIILQKIDREDLPSVLMPPVYIPDAGDYEALNVEQRRNRRKNRIENYNSAYGRGLKFEDALAFFDIASQTGMYFACFDALLGMVKSPYNIDVRNYLDKNGFVKLAHFFKLYYERQCRNFKRIGYADLWRMANELLFDWALIPRSQWESEFSDDLSPVIELLKHRPDVEGDNYNYENFILNKYRTFNLIGRGIDDDDMNKILRTITGQFGRGRNSVSFWNEGENARSRMVMKLFNDQFFVDIERYISY